MITLLDINVLLALADGAHLHHREAISYFPLIQPEGWATCPLTENGFLRIHGHARYPGGPGSLQHARIVLESLTSQAGHQFWPNDLSLCDAKSYPALPASKPLTNLYLLALAAKRGGRFATLDQGIDPTWVPGGAAALYQIST